MSLRERILLVLGILGAVGLVVYPLAHRLSTEGSTGGAEVVVSVAPTATAPAATATPTRIQLRPTPSPRDASWEVQAGRHRGDDDAMYEYECSPDGTLGQIWGTDIYTDDTSVCTAGVHAGVITREDGGTVTIIIRPGQAAYVGSARNGVASQPYDDWDGSFEVVRP